MEVSKGFHVAVTDLPQGAGKRRELIGSLALNHRMQDRSPKFTKP